MASNLAHGKQDKVADRQEHQGDDETECWELKPWDPQVVYRRNENRIQQDPENEAKESRCVVRLCHLHKVVYLEGLQERKA